MNHRMLWLGALGQWSVWKRALKMGLTVGVLQAVINQGDVWWRGEAKAATVAKTIISPLVTFSIVWISAAATWVEDHRGGGHGS